MDDTSKLNDMLQSLIDSNDDKAQVDFHEYLVDKMKTQDAASEDDSESDTE